VWISKVECLIGELNKNFKRKRRVDFYHFNLFIYKDKIMSEQMRKDIDKVLNWKQFLNENFNSDKKYYHSTFGRNIDDIMKNGLSNDVDSLYPIDSGYIYMTDNVDTAEWFAKNYIKQTGEEDDVYVLEISGIDNKSLKKDPFNEYPHIKSYRYPSFIPIENLKIVKHIPIE